MTSLSYVMSLMPDAIVQRPRPPRHGYHVYPMGPSYLGLPDGRGLVMGEERDGPLRHASAAFSKRDAAGAGAVGRLDGRHRRRARTAAHPGAAQARLEAPGGPARPAQGWRGGCGGSTSAQAADVTRLFTMSDRRPAAGVVRDRCRAGDDGRQRRHRHVGRAGGAGHRLRDAAPLDRRRRRRVERSVQWGYPRGGMGAVADAIRRAAESFGVDGAHRRAGRAGADRATAGSPASPSSTARSWRPTGRRHRRAPADRLPPPPRRRRAARRLRRRHPALAQPQRHGEGQPRALASCPTSPRIPARTCSPTTPEPSSWPTRLDYLETAFQEARSGQPADPAVQRRLHPQRCSTDRCAPTGTHVMSLFTQWVPSTWSDEPHQDELEAYADRVVAGYDRAGARTHALDHPPPGHRPLRDGAHLRADRRQHLPR